MLQLHSGNRLEDLADALLASLRGHACSPLEPWTVICESRALAAWLKRRICLEQGIACLVDTPLPAAWLWQSVRTCLNLPAEDDPLSREALIWRLLALLNPENLARDTAFDELSRYLRDDDSGLKRWQLAERLADAFDRYQYHRPELIRRWSGGEEDHWQARLWRSLVEAVDSHRVALIDRFLSRVRAGETGALAGRVDLFSIHNLPPLLMEAYAALSRHIDLHLWQLAPTEQYWADLTTPREMAARRRANPDDLALWQQGNPLLTQWGREVRSFQDALLRDDLEMHIASEHFHPPERDSLLHQLQADVYDAVDTSPQAAMSIPDEAPLPSLQLHVCHSPMRECQALHDTLLHCLQADETLQPEDILVMAPRIGDYAPCIQAVFGNAQDNTRLPFHIADVLHADEHPLIHAFLGLLDLPAMRFTRAELLGLADLPQVRRRFGLEETDLADLARLFDELRVYWGLDDAHRQALGLPDLDDNTWHQAMQRVMAGLALGENLLETGQGRVIVPAAGVGARLGECAARFFDLLDTLRAWAGRLDETARPGEWSERLGRMLDDLFANDASDGDRLQRIREALGDLVRVDALGTGPITRTMVRQFLISRTASEHLQGRLYREGITFCALRPMRGVPFRVIALLGMQDTDFPRRGRMAEFDRMTQRRHGDPDPGQEDRYLFLETLLAARERLLISYTGRNARTNDPLEPSVVVRELTDYLDERYRFTSCPDLPISQALTRYHAPHPFSPRNFTSSADEDEENRNTHTLPRPISHDHRWHEAALAISQHHRPERKSGWPTLTLPEPEPARQEISPGALAQFLRDPARQFVQQRLRIHEPQTRYLAEDEPFNLNNLQQWEIRNLWLQCWQAGEPAESARQQIRARGLLPHGPWGEQSLARAQEKIEAIAARCQQAGLAPPFHWQPTDIDLSLETRGGNWRISGRMTRVLEGRGPVLLDPGRFSMSKLLELWVQHLCLQGMGNGRGQAACAFFSDKTVCIQALNTEEAKAELRRLLEHYHQGLLAPLPLPRKTFDRFAESLVKSQQPDWEAALRAALREWDASGSAQADKARFFNRLILHGHDWIPDETFAETARQLLEPLRARMTLTP